MKQVKWVLYQNVLIPTTKPHIEINISKSEANKLLKQLGGYFVRWTNEWDRKDGEFWYIIKDKKESLEQYNSNNRRKIRKGLKNCDVKIVSNNLVAKYGYEVYNNAFNRYNTFLNPVSKKKFQNSILKDNKYEYWGVFYQNILVAYAKILVDGNVCNYSVIKFHPQYLKYYISYALFYEMNEYYLNEKQLLYVHDGSRSLSHDTNIHEFLINKFNFRRAYCKLNIVYRKDIELLVKLIYPFRKIIYHSKNNILAKLGVLLKHEEIRRSYS